MCLDQRILGEGDPGSVPSWSYKWRKWNRKTNYNSGGLYRGDVSNAIPTGLIWSSMVFWAFWHLFQKYWLKNDVAPAKKLFRGWGLKGGLKKNGFTQIFYLFQRLWRSVLCLGHRFGVNESILTVKITHWILVAWKMTLLINFRGCKIFSFDCCITRTLGGNFKFVLLNWRKSQKKHSENLKTVPLAVSSVLHVLKSP